MQPKLLVFVFIVNSYITSLRSLKVYFGIQKPVWLLDFTRSIKCSFFKLACKFGNEPHNEVLNITIEVQICLPTPLPLP